MNVKFWPAAFVLASMLVSCGPPSVEGQEQTSPATEMTALPTGAFTRADDAELTAALDRVEKGQTIFAGLPNPPLSSCALATDTPLCRYEQLKFVRQWRSAHEGDYQAQRNVAYCLGSKCDGVQQNKVQGCAWRAIIIDAADPAMSDGDVSNLNVDCGSLDPAGRAAADTQAARIKGLIGATKS